MALDKYDFENLIQTKIELYKKNGDTEPVLTALTPWVINYLKKRFRASDDAIGDILLMMTEKITRILNSYIAKEDFPFSFWLATVLRHNFIDTLRKNSKEKNETVVNKPRVPAERLGYFPKENSNFDLEPFLQKLKTEEYMVIKLLHGFEMDHKLIRLILEKKHFEGPENLDCLMNFNQKMMKKRVTVRKKENEIIKKIQYLQKRKGKLDDSTINNKINTIQNSLSKLKNYVSLEDLGKLFNCHRVKIQRIRDRANKKLKGIIPLDEWQKANMKPNSELNYIGT
jgi:RNA polymerase sigma factor (sigma-70 family)